MIFCYYPDIHFYTHFSNPNSQKKNSLTSKKFHFRRPIFWNHTYKLESFLKFKSWKFHNHGVKFRTASKVEKKRYQNKPFVIFIFKHSIHRNVRCHGRGGTVSGQPPSTQSYAKTKALYARYQIQLWRWGLYKQFFKVKYIIFFRKSNLIKSRPRVHYARTKMALGRECLILENLWVNKPRLTGRRINRLTTVLFRFRPHFTRMYSISIEINDHCHNKRFYDFFTSPDMTSNDLKSIYMVSIELNIK